MHNYETHLMAADAKIYQRSARQAAEPDGGQLKPRDRASRTGKKHCFDSKVTST
jgi:hypothetical protein